ncbi:MAG: AAA family ATPase [Pirellulales bacterium]
MSTAQADLRDSRLLASLLTNDVFLPAEPQSLEETGVSPILIEMLICKYVMQVGSTSGREIAQRLCLPFGILEDVLLALRSRQVLVHQGQAQLNDYCYALTEQGLSRARAAMQACSYVGPVPVPLDDYVMSVDAQTIRAEAARREQLVAAFRGISVEPELFDLLGPAVNSGAGMFLYGAPGNGKTTIAKRITRCFGQHIWIPRTLCEDGQFIKLYDAACHEAVEESEESIFKTGQVDHRWIKIRRPTVVVGGELTMDNLEIRYDPKSNVSEASLQLKSNCGCLLVDDFGRQRIDADKLLNRWIVPLESQVDYLTLATGKKIQVPFEQLIIFSTNLEPLDLADEAFLRRIPYKIEVKDPSLAEFSRLFEAACQAFGCRFFPEAVHYLIQTHYVPNRRPMRRCHARDLLAQIKNYCTYNGRPMELRPDYLDRVVKSYFTTISEPVQSPASKAFVQLPVAESGNVENRAEKLPRAVGQEVGKSLQKAAALGASQPAGTSSVPPRRLQPR